MTVPRKPAWYSPHFVTSVQHSAQPSSSYSARPLQLVVLDCGALLVRERALSKSSFRAGEPLVIICFRFALAGCSSPTARWKPCADTGSLQPTGLHTRHDDVHLSPRVYDGIPEWVRAHSKIDPFDSSGAKVLSCVDFVFGGQDESRTLFHILIYTQKSSREREMEEAL